MAKINLDFKTVTNIDLSGFKFYVEEGRLFDVDDYAQAYSINRHDINEQHVHSAEDAAGRLLKGEWLEVTHNSPEE